MPPPLRLVSKLPSALYRTRAKSDEPYPNWLLYPATKILPSDCRETLYALSSPDRIAVVTIPSPSKLVSKLPLALYRTKAKS